MAREVPQNRAWEAQLHPGGASAGRSTDDLIDLLLNFELPPEQVYQQAQTLLSSRAPDLAKPSRVIDKLRRAAKALPSYFTIPATQIKPKDKEQVQAFHQKLKQRAAEITKYLQENKHKLEVQHMEQRQQQRLGKSATQSAQQSAKQISPAEREFQQAPAQTTSSGGSGSQSQYAILDQRGAFYRLPSGDPDFLREELQRGSLVLHAQHEVPVVPGEPGYVIKDMHGDFAMVYGKDKLSARWANTICDTHMGQVYDLATGKPITKLPSLIQPGEFRDPIAFVVWPNKTIAAIYSEAALDEAKKRNLNVLDSDQAYTMLDELNEGQRRFQAYLEKRKIAQSQPTAAVQQPVQSAGVSQEPVPTQRPAATTSKPAGGAPASQVAQQILQENAPVAAPVQAGIAVPKGEPPIGASATPAEARAVSMPLPTPPEQQAMRVAQQQRREVLRNVKAPPPTPAAPAAAPAAAELGTTMAATPQELLVAAAPAAAALVSQATASPASPIPAAATPSAGPPTSPPAAPAATPPAVPPASPPAAPPAAPGSPPPPSPTPPPSGAGAPAQAAAQAAQTSRSRQLLTQIKKYWWVLPLVVAGGYLLNRLAASQSQPSQPTVDWTTFLLQQQQQEQARRQALQYLYEQLLEQHRQYFPPPSR
jgi:hypothetical protein